MSRITTRTELDRALQRVRAWFSGELAFAARNLKTGEEILVDADRVYPTASTIKLAILVEVFRQAQTGELDLHERLVLREAEIVRGSGILKELGGGLQPTIYDLATLMVVLSDNTATNMLIDRVGGLATINRTMQEGYGLKTMVLHNRVDFAAIGDDIRRFGESSPADIMELVALMLGGQAVDKQSSAAMIDILGRQQYLDQVPRYISFNPYAKELGLDQTIFVGCKTGFYTGTRVDGGALVLPDETAIAYCAMTAGGADGSFGSENEGAVANGLLGYLMLEYWWPGEWDAAKLALPSPYSAAVLQVTAE